MSTKWMDPYERVALLEQELENIEEREAARKQSRRLSLEECVYWMLVAGRSGLGFAIIDRAVWRLKAARILASKTLRDKSINHGFRREAGFVAFLCGEALRALGADQ